MTRRTAITAAFAILLSASPQAAELRVPPEVAVRATDARLLLTNTAGRSLYIYEKDKPEASACVNADCAALWPPLVAPESAVPPPYWAVLVRSDGLRQWVYK